MCNFGHRRKLIVNKRPEATLMHAAIFTVVPPLARLLLRDELREPTNQSWAGLFSQCRHGVLLSEGWNVKI
jgi:hypothetical protein